MTGVIAVAFVVFGVIAYALPRPGPHTARPGTVATPTPTPTVNEQAALLALVPRGIRPYCQAAQAGHAVRGLVAGLTCGDTGTSRYLTYALFDDQADLDAYYAGGQLRYLGITENSGTCLDSVTGQFDAWGAPCEAPYHDMSGGSGGRMAEFDPASGGYEIACTDDARVALVTIWSKSSGDLLGYWNDAANWIGPPRAGY